GRDAELAGPSAGNRTAHPGVRQIPAYRWDLLARRLRLRPQARLLHLPGREETQATAKGLSDAAAPGRSKRYDALWRQQAGLPRLFAEAAVLSECTGAEDPALNIASVGKSVSALAQVLNEARNPCAVAVPP